MMKLNPKSKASILSIISNLFLIVFKLIIGFATNSISVISDGIHSFIDLISSLATFTTLQFANKPPDEQHNYGHQKIEDIGSLIQFLLIFGTGILIIILAINKIFNPSPMGYITIAFITMFISVIINLTVALGLKDMAKQYDSVALLAEGKHRMSDVYSSLGIGIGLLLVWIFKIGILDQIISILVGILICYESLDIVKQSLNSLLDHSLPQTDIDVITNILNKYKDNYCKYYDLKTRKSGSQKYMEINLVIKEEYTMKQVTKLCQMIEKDINNELKNIDILIQVESNFNDKLTCKASNKNKLKINFLYKNFRK